METVTVAEARRNFADLIARVGFGGRRIVIERHGKPVVALVSYEDLQRLLDMERRQAADGEKWQQALEKARAASAAILVERSGEYLPGTAGTIRELREERDDELIDRS